MMLLEAVLSMIQGLHAVSAFSASQVGGPEGLFQSAVFAVGLLYRGAPPEVAEQNGERVLIG